MKKLTFLFLLMITVMLVSPNAMGWQNPGILENSLTATADISLYEGLTGLPADELSDGVQANHDNPGERESNNPLREDEDVVITEFPWLEDFEGEDFPPVGWTRLELGASNDGWEFSSNNHTPDGLKSAGHQYTFSAAEGWLITPAIEIPEEDTYELSFWSYNAYAYAYGKNSVHVSTGSSDPADGGFLEIWSPESIEDYSWIQTNLNLNAYAGETIYIAFVYEGNYQHDWYVDDVLIEEAFVEFYDVTFVVTEANSEGAPLENAAVNIDGYDSVYTDHEGLVTLEMVDGSYSASVSLDGYQEENVDFIVNGDDKTVQVEMHAMLFVELPYYEDFTDTPYDEVPADWTRTHDNWGAMDVNMAGGEVPELTFWWSPQAEDVIRAITPMLDATEHTNVSLSFLQFVDVFQGGYDLKVQTSVDGEVWTDQWVLEVDETRDPNPDRANPGKLIRSEEIIINLDGVDGETFFLAFVFDGNSFDINSWHIDNVWVGEGEVVYPITILVTDDSADEIPLEQATVVIEEETFHTDATGEIVTELPQGSYTANVSADGYEPQEVSFTVEDDPLFVHVMLSAESEEIIITDFPWLEDFEIDGFSDTGWTTIAAGDAPGAWDLSTGQNHTQDGQKSARHTFYSPPAEGWLISPAIQLPAENVFELSFWSFNEWSGYYEKNSVHVSTGSPDPADGEFVEIWSPESVAAAWEQTILSLDDYAGETIHVAFVYEATWAHVWYVDDVMISQAPEHYNVTFHVKEDTPEEDAIEGAVILIDSEELITGTDGTATANLMSGQDYTATISAEGYYGNEVTFEVIDDDLDIEVFMEIIPVNYISFSVVDEYEQAVENAEIVVVRESNKSITLPAPAANAKNTEVSQKEHQTQTPQILQATPHTNTGEMSENFSKLDGGEWLYYYNSDAINDNAIGLNSPGEWNAAIRWEPSDLQAYDGHAVSIIEVFMNDEPSGATAKIWQGPDAANLTLKVEALMGTAEEDWVELILETPYVIDANEELWIGWVVDDPGSGSFPAAVCDSAEPNGYGNMLQLSGNDWQPASDYGLAGMWNLQVFVEEGPVTLYTDENGYASFEGTNGNYLFTVVKEGYDPYESSFYVENEDHHYDVSLTGGEPPLYVVTFEVMAENGSTIDNAVVTFDGVSYSAGHYVIEEVEAGTYDYVVERDDYHTAEGTVNVDGDATVEVILVQEETDPETFTVTFGIVDEEGIAVDDAVLTFDGVTYDAGHYVMDEVEVGNYDYAVARDGYHTAEGTVNVDGDITVEIVLIEDDDVSVMDSDPLTLDIFPNPASSSLFVESDVTISIIRMIDMLGQVVYSSSVDDQRHEIQVSSFKPGMYFIQLTTPQGIITHRVQVAM